jgi:iron(III) transport system substrate-binding protein
MRNSKGLRPILVGGLGLIATLAVGAQARAQSWDDTIAAARKEGRLVIYSAHVGNPLLKAMGDAFTAKYGIPHERLEARASELRERTRVEYSAGRNVADVTFTSSGQAVLISEEDKVFARHDPVPNGKGLREGFSDDGLFAPVMILNYGLLVNTSQVKPEEMPKSWSDLAHPRWKGRILADDTRAIGGGYLYFYVTFFNQAMGEKYHQIMAAQALSFTRNQREAQRRVARGEYAIYSPFILSDIANLKGLPVRAVILDEGAPYVLYGNVAMRNAPHPNAARLYIDFSMSEEAQLIWAQGGHGFVRAGLEGKVPADLREIANPKLMGTTDQSRQDEGLREAKRIYN